MNAYHIGQKFLIEGICFVVKEISQNPLCLAEYNYALEIENDNERLDYLPGCSKNDKTIVKKGRGLWSEYANLETGKIRPEFKKILLENYNWELSRD